MKKKRGELESESNSTVYKRIKRTADGLRCSHCPPNKGENASRKPKYGEKKPKKKDKRVTSPKVRDDYE